MTLTLDFLESQLLELNQHIERIFDMTNYKDIRNLSSISYTDNDFDSCMKYFEFQSIFSHLDFINSVLTYLQKPIGRTGIIEQLSHNKYKLADTILTHGSVIEVLTHDSGSALTYWQPRIIKSSSVDLVGMTARFRGNNPPRVL